MTTGIKAEIGDYFYVEVNGYDMRFEVFSDTEAMPYKDSSAWSSCISTSAKGEITIPSLVTNPDDGRSYRVTKIGSFAFSRCSKITKVTIPEGVTRISTAAFQNCNGLVNASLPSTLKTIEPYAFNGCEKLSSIALPDALEFIGECAFQSCLKITSIFIPKNVKTIDGSFGNMTSLETITLSSANTYFDMVDGVLFQTKDGKRTLIHYPQAKAGTSYTVPSDVDNIEAYSFNGAQYLKTCYIPDHVTEIGERTFTKSSIVSCRLSENITKIRQYTFSSTKLTSIDIPAKVAEIYDNAFDKCTDLKKVMLNNKYNNTEGSEAFLDIAGDAVLYVPIEYLSNYKKNPWKQWFASIKSFVPINETHFPDENFRTALREYDFGSDGRLMEEEIAEIDVIEDYTIDAGIEDLTGIEYFTALTDLSFGMNQVKTADLSKNVNLSGVSCETNQIMGEDMDFFVEHLPDVRPYSATLWVYDNTNGRSDGNEMTPEQVSVAKQKGWKVKVYNKNDRTWSETQGFRLIREKWFPDPAMRHALSKAYFRCGEEAVTVEDAEEWCELEFGYETEITDLTGIDFFTGLEGLYFTGNKVKRVDLSKLTNLNNIQCEMNQIQGTDMDYFVNHLPYASDSDGYISVYWGSNKNYVEGNEMTPEQVKKANQKGWKVTVYDDVEQGFGYETAGFWLVNEERFPDPVFRNYVDVKYRYWNDFHCKGALTMEDVEGIDEFGVECVGVSDLTGIECFTEMESLLACGNHLTTIDLSQNKNLNHLECYANNIKGQGMDDLIASLPKRSVSAPGDLCVYDDSSSQYPEHNVMTADQVAAAKLKNWIPYKWDKNKWDWVEFSGNDVPTGVDDALPLNANGQTMNDEDGWYTIDGRKLDSTPAAKGVYVRNGKKVVVK